jgi:hypothetical protein
MLDGCSRSFRLSLGRAVGSVIPAEGGRVSLCEKFGGLAGDVSRPPVVVLLESRPLVKAFSAREMRLVMTCACDFFRFFFTKLERRTLQRMSTSSLM